VGRDTWIRKYAERLVAILRSLVRPKGQGFALFLFNASFDCLLFLCRYAKLMLHFTAGLKGNLETQSLFTVNLVAISN
jgi:hypothetical protein